MRFRTVLTYLSMLSLGACTKSCKDYDNAAEFNNAKLPAYSETGANTLGCRLGTQVWTALGAHYLNRIGYPWEPNGAFASGLNSPEPLVLEAQGQMTGVRDSKEFYDTSILFTFHPTDTLGGVQLLGDSARLMGAGRRADGLMAVTNLLKFASYTSSSRRPVRLVVRKHDPQQKIVSGIFEGYVYNTNDARDSLAVTDGRFDFRYAR